MYRDWTSIGFGAALELDARTCDVSLGSLGGLAIANHGHAMVLERLLCCLFVDGIPRGVYFICPSNRGQAAQMLNDTG